MKKVEKYCYIVVITTKAINLIIKKLFMSDNEKKVELF